MEVQSDEASDAGIPPPADRRRLLFFTVNLADRRSCLLTDRVGDLRHAVRRVRALAPFRIDAWVVLAHHMHAIWMLPEGDDDFRRRWRTIKDLFSRRLDLLGRVAGSRAS